MVGSIQHVDDRDMVREQSILDVHNFASIDCFRSATTEELIGDGDPLRRPIRPEDVFLLNFTQQLNAQNVLGLGGLIGHRTLLNAYEVDYLWRPASGKDLDMKHAFYGAEASASALKARRRLEPYLFDHLGSDNVAELRSRDPLSELCERLLQEQEELTGALEAVASSIANRPDLRDFVLIQDCGLDASRYAATQTATAHGTLLSTQAARSIAVSRTNNEHRDAALRTRGLDATDHNYWQFYLSSAIGCTNLLYRHRQSTIDAGVMTGVSMYYAMYSSLRDQILLDLPTRSKTVTQDKSLVELLIKDCASIADQFGPDTASLIIKGFCAAKAQWAHFFDDLGAQLKWLSNIDAYAEIAQRIMSTIENSNETVDLDTFVETLDMCSTTHVHDEHRLVVVESGKMVFWANAGMRLSIDAGEMTLVPIHRLHGSSIETQKCTYHQPIIEPEWLERHGISLDS